MSQQTPIRERLRAFLFENFLYMRPDFVLGDDDHLLERGVVDSMGIAELLTFMEDEFGVTVADSDVSEANLGSLRALTNFVAAKQGNGTVPVSGES